LGSDKSGVAARTTDNVRARTEHSSREAYRELQLYRLYKMLKALLIGPRDRARPKILISRRIDNGGSRVRSPTAPGCPCVAVMMSIVPHG